MEKVIKKIGFGYTLQIVSDFKNPEMLEICKEWSIRTTGKPDLVYRKPQWFVNNLIYAILVFDLQGLLVGCAGMIRSYEDRKPVFYETPMGEKLPVYELCANDVLHDGMGIAKLMIAERLLIAEEKNWACVIVTKNPAIKKNARGFKMIQVSRSNDGTIKAFGEQIRICDCTNPDGTAFWGELCDTCPRNVHGENGKRIFLYIPGLIHIQLPEIHEKIAESV